MATKDQKKADAQANATEPNEGVTHDASGATGAPANADSPQGAKDAEGGVQVRFGKYLKEMDSMEVVIGGETYREGDRVDEGFLDSDANKAPSGGKYLVKKGGE